MKYVSSRRVRLARTLNFPLNSRKKQEKIVFQYKYAILSHVILS